MNRENGDKLEEILQNTAQTKERANQIEQRLENLERRHFETTQEKRERINELESKTRRNSLILTAWIFIIMTTLTAFSSWAFGFV